MLVSFDIGVSLSDPAWAAVAPTLYWTQISVCTFHCGDSIIARGSESCAARAALGRRSRGCTRRRGRTGRTGRSTGRSRRGGAWTSRVRLLVRAERRSDQRSTSSRTCFQSHRDSRGGLRYRNLARFPSRRIVILNHGLNHGSSQMTAAP